MIQINRKELADAFKGLSLIATQTDLPILSQVLFDAKGGVLTASADNMDMRGTFYMDCLKSAKLSATCMCKEGSAFLAALDCDEVGLDFDQDKTIIANGKVKMSLPSLDPMEFPTAKDKKGIKSVTFTLDAPELLAALKTVKAGISTEETRYYLNGVFFTHHKNRLRFVTTDGHRMHIKDLGQVPAFDDAILPRDFIVAVMTRLAKREGPVLITFYPEINRAVFTFGRESWETKLIDGTFPDYKRVMPDPKLLKSSVTFESAELLKCLKTMGKASNATAVRLSFADGLLTVTSRSPDGASITYEVGAASHGKPFPECGFNQNYLKDCITALDSEHVTFKVSDATSPAEIQGDSKDARMVLMPRRV